MNLSFYRKEYNAQFMCPLCLRTFTRDRIEKLDRAHIIPKSLGGNQVTLSCKECNSFVGRNLECYEAERVNFNWALSGEGDETTRVRLVVYNEQGDTVGLVQADMRGDPSGGDDRIQLYLQQNGSNPAAFKLLNDLLSGNTSAGSWTIKGHYRETRNPKRANLTYIHAAYLLMFHQFGYEWVLNPCAQPIREQILHPDAEKLQLLAPRLDGIDIPLNKPTLLLVTQPVAWRKFLVVLPNIRGWDSRQGVWLPLFGCPYDLPPRVENEQLQIKQVPDHHHYLDQPHSVMQGLDFTLAHFDYDPVLYAGRNWFEEYG